MSFPPSPSPPNGWSLWFITESEITKSGWDINVSLELCSVLGQYLTHYGLLPCVVKNMEPISELLSPGWRALIHTLVPVLWILLGNIQWRRMWLYQWPLLPEYPEFTGDFEVGAHQIQILVLTLVGYICSFITLTSFSSCVKWWQYYLEGKCGVNELVWGRCLPFDRYSINIQLVPYLFNPGQAPEQFQCSKCRWHFKRYCIKASCLLH